jgi:hypothetical protein
MAALKRYLKLMLKCLLLIIFLSYYSSISMFYHAHHINGFVLSHSHPYKHNKTSKTPYESHPHSSQAYSYIHQINEAGWKDTSSSVEITSPVINFFVFTGVYNTPFVKAITFSLSLLRAPPVIC